MTVCQLLPAIAAITRTGVTICVGSELFPWSVSAQHEDHAGESIEYIAIDKGSWSLTHCVAQRISKHHLCTVLGNSECIIDELRSARERATFTDLSPILEESLMQNLHGKNGHRKRKRMMDNVATPDSLGWVRVTVRGVEYPLKATVDSRSSIHMKLDPAVVAGFIKTCAGGAMLGQACVFMLHCRWVC